MHYRSGIPCAPWLQYQPMVTSPAEHKRARRGGDRRRVRDSPARLPVAIRNGAQMKGAFCSITFLGLLDSVGIGLG